jgi:hypothetical protein
LCRSGVPGAATARLVGGWGCFRVELVTRLCVLGCNRPGNTRQVPTPRARTVVASGPHPRDSYISIHYDEERGQTRGLKVGGRSSTRVPSPCGAADGPYPLSGPSLGRRWRPSRRCRLLALHGCHAQSMIDNVWGSAGPGTPEQDDLVPVAGMRKWSVFFWTHS